MVTDYEAGIDLSGVHAASFIGFPLSIACADHFLNVRMSFSCFYKAVGNVGTRNRESEARQVAFADPIPSGERTVSQPGWAHDSPMKAAFEENALHRSCVSDDTGKE